MDSKKVLFFLDLLNKETTGHADDIARLYKRALDENDDVMRLNMYLHDYVYYREIGSALCEDGTKLIRQLYENPTNALSIIPYIKQMHESIGNSARVCDDLMHSPLPFSDAITVLKKKDTIAFMNALKMIASCSVYLMMVYSGLDSIKDLTWNDTAGIQEMIYAVNTKFLPALCKTNKPSYSWVIRRRRLGGKALFGGDGYFLSYERSKSVEVLCGALHKEPLGTHAFLNINAYESGELDVPFCWGVGNIVSVLPSDAIMCLQNDVASKLRSPSNLELSKKVPTPFECANILADGMVFCITPDELVLAMNQWQLGHEIAERRKTHNCLFCGRHVDNGKLVCSSHFSTELN